jgi:hypothetical protein
VLACHQRGEIECSGAGFEGGCGKHRRGCRFRLQLCSLGAEEELPCSGFGRRV